MPTKKKVATKKSVKKVIKKAVKKTVKAPVLTCRTQEEIVARIESVKADDFFGFETYALINYLDFDHAKQFLKPEATFKEWDLHEQKTAEESIKDYMTFAWGKANDKRGISAGRSIAHMRAWVWLAGNQELLDFLNEDKNYVPYGKPMLAKICEVYGLTNEDNGSTDTE